MLSRIFGREPVAITNAITAVVALLVLVGLPIPDGFAAALSAAIVTVGTLVARANVYAPIDEHGEDRSFL